VRVLIAALDSFARESERQASDEAGWPEDDVPDAHVVLLRDWAARARAMCDQAEQTLDTLQSPVTN
jgi:hypothetical protein